MQRVWDAALYLKKKKRKKKEMSGIGRRMLLLKMSWSKVVKQSDCTNSDYKHFPFCIALQTVPCCNFR